MNGHPVTVSYARLHRALRKHGVRGCARHAFQLARTRRARRAWARADRAFDAHHGVDTTGIVPLEALTISSENKGLGIRYQPSDPAGFRALIESLDEPRGELTFVDLGAGKGRTLLLASELGFRRIVGVEFAPELCAIARHNVAAYPPSAARADDVEIVCSDAAHWPLPDSPLLLYVYNAFEPPLMAEVLRRIHRSWEERPRTILLALVNRTIDAEELARIGFRLVMDDEHGEVYVPC